MGKWAGVGWNGRRKNIRTKKKIRGKKNQLSHSRGVEGRRGGGGGGGDERRIGDVEEIGTFENERTEQVDEIDEIAVEVAVVNNKTATTTDPVKVGSRGGGGAG